MSSVLKGFYEALIYREKEGYLFHQDPLAKIFTILFHFLLIFIGNLSFLMILFSFFIIECFFNNVGRRILQGIKSLSLPLIFIFTLVSLFQGFHRAIKVTFTIFNFMLVIALFSVTTNPLSIVRALERVGIPLKIAYGPALAIKLIPEIVSDALDSILSFTLRGEFKKKVGLGSLSKVLTALTAASLIESQHLGAALAVKGFTSKTRKSIYEVDISWEEITRFSVFLGLFLIYLFFPSFILFNFTTLIPFFH